MQNPKVCCGALNVFWKSGKIGDREQLSRVSYTRGLISAILFFIKQCAIYDELKKKRLREPIRAACGRPTLSAEILGAID